MFNYTSFNTETHSGDLGHCLDSGTVECHNGTTGRVKLLAVGLFLLVGAAAALTIATLGFGVPIMTAVLTPYFLAAVGIGLVITGAALISIAGNRKKDPGFERLSCESGLEQVETSYSAEKLELEGARHVYRVDTGNETLYVKFDKGTGSGGGSNDDFASYYDEVAYKFSEEFGLGLVPETSYYDSYDALPPAFKAAIPKPNHSGCVVVQKGIEGDALGPKLPDWSNLKKEEACAKCHELAKTIDVDVESGHKALMMIYILGMRDLQAEQMANTTLVDGKVGLFDNQAMGNDFKDLFTFRGGVFKPWLAENEKVANTPFSAETRAFVLELTEETLNAFLDEQATKGHPVNFRGNIIKNLKFIQEAMREDGELTPAKLEKKAAETPITF